MVIDLVFIVLLTGHILGDFYFQTNKLAKEKKTSAAAVFRHCLIYFVTMAAVLSLGLPLSRESVLLCISASLSHMAIDLVKYWCINAKTKHGSLLRKVLHRVTPHLFIIDQCCHFAVLAFAWWLWGREPEVRWFVSQEMHHLPALPVTMLLGALCILRPVSIFISDTPLWNTRQTAAISDDVANAGRSIGYLERLIIYVFLIYGQFSAIVFVLTAKSVARFKAIEQNKATAEYYLIGTLLSVVSAIAITFLLGLCASST